MLMKIKDLIRQNYKYDTKFQRGSDAWTTKLRKLLIDSIWNNYYIPEVLIANNEVMDGKQRISAIIQFTNDKFDVILDNRKIKYSDLNEFEQSRFDNYEINVRDLGNIDENKILTTFLRINEGSVKLSKAELLMAKATDLNRELIKNLAMDKKIIEMSNNKKNDKRFTIEELIIRIFSIIDIQKTKQKGSVRSNMENIIKNKIVNDIDLAVFKEAINVMFLIVGNDTIRIKSFNTLFESIFMSFFNNIEHKNSFLNNQNILKKELYNVQNAINEVQMGGGNKYDDFKYVKNRIGMVDNILCKYFKDKKRNFTYDEKLEIWNNNEHSCMYCKKTLKNISEFEPDHVVSHTMGGKTRLENSQILCMKCNRTKSGK
ncbi:HNH endonuclease family protein [Spiroplasma endosymbiont of Cantharis rufa]|uniref:HNH endonuclease family protein n=1 Tax=Spiroplasma endosymbiont of Cantharis rufa TaxID=3066279 RepID=UPI0030D61DFE